jgi:hypothetical protein
MKKTILLWKIALLSILAVSCENELSVEFVEPSGVEIDAQEEFIPNEGPIQLGRKLDNPYSVTNMRKALEMLPADVRGVVVAEDIQPTHLYLKFAPANVDELDALLWSDSSLDFYSYPLDYERQTGGYYRDPSLPKDVPTYQYVSIPVGHPIPEVCKYEVLEELYIPEELTELTRTLSPSFVNALVKQSFELTDNEYDGDVISTRADGRANAYTFSGTIRAFDDLVGDYVPVPGAVIRCTRWFTTVKAITNTNGYYVMERESQNEYNYAICWERDNKYDIREGELDQAVTDGPKTSGSWSVDMSKDNGYPRGVNFATITRAAYRYFYGNTGGIYKAEPMATGDLKICYMHEHNENDWAGYFDPNVTFELTGDIFIYGKKANGSLYETQDVFMTTAHEMTHANQCVAMTVSNYTEVDSFLKESWAVFGSTYLAYLEYGELGEYLMNNFDFEDFCTHPTYNDHFETYLKWPVTRHDEYSCFFIDLFDNYNQRVELNNSNLPNDVIYGYSPSVLNAMVIECYDLEDIRLYLKANNPTYITDAMIDMMVNYYAETK